MSQGNTKYWYALIKYWSRDLKRSGLTIPFIIGAQEFADSNKLDISSLLEEIRNTETEEKIIIRYCGDLKEYVLGLDEIAYPVAKYLNGDNFILFFDSEIEQLGKFENIKKHFTQLYGAIVFEKKYSNVLGHWEYFTEKDIEMIKQAFRSNYLIR